MASFTCTMSVHQARGSAFAAGSARLPACAPRRVLPSAAVAAAPRAMADGDKAAAPALQWAKASDARGLSDSALVAEIESCKKELVLLSVKKATRQEVKAHHFALLRKKVAILKTVRRERELEQGVKKRESRKVDLLQTQTRTFW